jgi:hypothetical protein
MEGVRYGRSGGYGRRVGVKVKGGEGAEGGSKEEMQKGGGGS